MRLVVSAPVLWMVAAATIMAGKEALVVDTDGGRITGMVEKSLSGREFYSFYGVPYAQPPLGKLRFKDPKAPMAWEGVRNGSIQPHPCLQKPMAEKQTGKEELIGHEDCLYLNVFTPEITPGDLPVIVWFHGGAFYHGSGLKYQPHSFLDRNIVFVVVQYRLSILGFLSTEDSVMPGNLGLKDQTMALQWVQRNIDQFGGDRTRVTITGQSAGGASVHFQIMSPKSQGLFSRAVLHSATGLCPWALNSKPREAALHVGRTLGCPTDSGSQALLDCLQEQEAENIVPLYTYFRIWGRLPFTLTPWVDGDFLPDHPAQLLREGRHAQIDIMSGVTKDEGALFALPPLDIKRLMDDIRNNFKVIGPVSLTLDDLDGDPVAVARRVYQYYLGTTHPTEEHAESLNRMLGDRHFAVCHDVVTAYHALLHPAKKTYRYELQHFAELSLTQKLCPSCDLEWVNHGDDLLYFFPPAPLYMPSPDQPEDLRRPEDLALRNIMTTLWENFAATGNPTPDDSLGFKWLPSTADNLHFLSLTPSPSMQPDSRKEVRKFLSTLPTRENLILAPHVVETVTEEEEQHANKKPSKTEL